MPSLSTLIEQYLKRELERAGGVLELQRSELAARFACAPSQINYVLETRFTPAAGYVIESRRGGRGFIRIVRLPVRSRRNLLALVQRWLGEMIDQDGAEALIARLEEEGVVSAREAALMRAAVHRDTLAVDLPWRDVVRARLLRAMILELLKRDGGGGDAVRRVPPERGDGAPDPDR
ncbi:MAG: transcriptional regulator [Bacillota bacterium]|nr:MAG: transcriptional regulator [Bacillota bacterium]